MGLAQAQSKGGGKGGGSRGGSDMGGGMPRQVRQTRIDAIGEKLKLSKEQKEQISTIFDAGQQKASPINEQIANGRKTITTAILSGKNSGPEWDGLMKAFTAVLAQEAALEADSYQKMFATLDDKQKPKAAPVFAELISGMYAGRNWRAMGGGMGGPGGMGGGMGR
jgi:hypothetical protein